ncbi:MAG: helix-turn-helix transcriptional regulator [Candidatus Obscuribacterales bacterium]|nr:helix-turn-helix transcriptional regulator [Candidatus Obscuribacterales bacterium]
MDRILVKSNVEPMLATLGQLIKSRRISLGLSQEELGKSSGLHRTYVSDVERGNRNMTLGATTLIAKGLGLQLRDLINALSVEVKETDSYSQNAPIQEVHYASA